MVCDMHAAAERGTCAIMNGTGSCDTCTGKVPLLGEDGKEVECKINLDLS